MPELASDMYCSQQICVPPTFPYLLRQYAKAAIRTQPTDLLKWSTAYFRCLSLNLPPPVKPRLEYPIPKDYEGITPGWLKALIYQLQKNQSVDFKVLWDRWTGACLQHQTLVQLLCMGGFTNPKAIPWLRFIALCAGHITENLTQTMILICDILTEEPEGGSSMIPVEIFVDLYKFLAGIDASQFQNLFNIHFTDDLLNLGDKMAKPLEVRVAKDIKEVVSVSESEESELQLEEEKGDLGSGEAISCPDIDGDIGEFGPALSDDKLLEQGEFKKDVRTPSMTTMISENTTSLEQGNDDVQDVLADVQDVGDNNDIKQAVSGAAYSEISVKSVNAQPEVVEQEPSFKSSGEKEGTSDSFVKGVSEAAVVSQEIVADPTAETADAVEAPEVTDVPTIPDRPSDTPIAPPQTPDEDAQDTAGSHEETSQHDEFRQSVTYIDGFPIDAGQAAEEGADYNTMQYEAMIKMNAAEYPDACEEATAESVEGEHAESEKSLKYETIEIEPIPGIGAIVPLELVQAVEEYMLKVSKNQHGNVMPRNIRHYTCPPLEVFD